MGIDHSNPYIHSTTVLCDMFPTFNILLAGDDINADHQDELFEEGALMMDI